MERLMLLLFTFLTVAILSEVNGINIENNHRFKMLNLFGYRDYRVLIGQNAIVTSNSEVTIICETTTDLGDEVIIEWVFNDRQVIFDSFNSIIFPNIRQYSGNEMIIINTTTLYTGTYECVLRDVNTGEELDRGMTKLEVLGECSDNCMGRKGKKGVQGQRGDTGEMGIQGVQGLCDPNVCYKKGINGSKGIYGAKGARGEDGAKGNIGESGKDGTNGTVGDKGEKGREGEIGEKGENGRNGENGEQGIEGERGEEGDQREI
ncbi:hypothetical protein LOD99_2480 [Oopsacas minuta]|uniref:Ig-like domain-containing protein n=1 Tax=Oopsacas minuta TaxID=111878 RepID=A0AAV7K221_9METZ|nr:hypothetical protein LOD99_2480 [Oopsacas minuta]